MVDPTFATVCVTLHSASRRRCQPLLKTESLDSAILDF